MDHGLEQLLTALEFEFSLAFRCQFAEAHGQPIIRRVLHYEDAGMDLPYACRQGSCVSCAAKITDGPAEEYITHHTQETLPEEMTTAHAHLRGRLPIDVSELPVSIERKNRLVDAAEDSFRCCSCAILSVLMCAARP